MLQANPLVQIDAKAVRAEIGKDRLLGMYRKEALGLLLAFRHSDRPKLTGDDYERTSRFPVGTIQVTGAQLTG